MKFGFRKPSIKKRIAARTSVKRKAKNALGLKAPRGWGWVTNPKKALYNRVYNRTTKKVPLGCSFLLFLCLSTVLGITLSLYGIYQWFFV